MPDPTGADPDRLAPRPAVPAAGAASPGGSGGAGAGGGRRTEIRALLEIVALCGLAITQPLLDITGRSPDFFLFHGAGPVEILLLVALFTLVPPALLWGGGALVGLAAPAARPVAHMVTVVGLLTALAIQVGKYVTPVRGVPLVLLALLFGAAGGWAYRRWQVPGQLLRVASVGPLVFVSIFVFASATSAVVLPGGAAEPTPSASADGADRPPVVFLVLDEFPLVSLMDDAGRIDAQRYPNFARLAGESTWYRNATAVSGWTPYALPAMLTGRYPSTVRAPHYSQYPENLFTAFGAEYDVRTWETISQLCPPQQCPEETGSARGGLPALLRESAVLLEEIVSPYDSDRDPETSYREETRQEAGATTQPQPAPTDPTFRWGHLAENQPARFTDFLADLRVTQRRPTLRFLHLLMPHSPWNYLPSGVRYESGPGMANDGDGWVSLAHQRHLAQVRYTDRLLGETLRTLEESGLYDDALLVVTSDHGVSFTPGVQGRSQESVDQSPAEVLWVPAFIKAPGQRSGVVDDRNWHHVDLLPTVADHAGVRIPWQVDGISALSETREGTQKRYHNEPDTPADIPGAETFAALVGGAAQPVLPAPLHPELVGREVAGLPVDEGGGGRATVANLGAFAEVEPASGRLPALVYGTVDGSVPNGAALAVAVNGRIGAVVPVVSPDPEGRRFGALVEDESLFVGGANLVEIFEVGPDSRLRRLAL